MPERVLDLDQLAEAREQRHAAEHATSRSGFRHHGERRHRVRRDQQLHQLHAHALARQLLEARARRDAGVQTRRHRAALRHRRMEAEEAQDAQIILGDARRRIADEAHAPRREIGEPADIVVHACRRRVTDSALMVKSRRSASALPVAAERDLGLAAEGLDVLAQRRHLERPAVDHHRDGAVLDAGRHRLEAGGLARGGSPRRASPWWRCRCRRSARRAARCAPRRRPRAPPRRRGRAPRAAAPAAPRVSQSARLQTARRASLASAPARTCRLPYAPGRRSSRAARRRNARARRSCRSSARSAAMVSQASDRAAARTAGSNTPPRVAQQEERVERRTARGTARSR